MRHLPIIVMQVVCLLSGVANSAIAAPLYHVRTNVFAFASGGLSANDEQTASNPVPVFRTATTESIGLIERGSYAAARASGRSGLGTVGGFLSTEAQSGSDSLPGVLAQANASATTFMRIEDIRIGGASGYDDVLVPVSVNLDLGGAIANAAGLRIEVTVQLSQPTGTLWQATGTLTPLERTGLLVGADLVGQSVNLTLDHSIGSPVVEVRPRDPITVELGFNLFSGIVLTSPLQSDETFVDFLGSFGFAGDRPVFNLPAGYRADSIDGGILDNRLVPEPGSLAIVMATILLGLLALRARVLRRHSR